MVEFQLHPFIAGMSVLTLTDLAGMRLEVLSFFLLTFLICGFILRACWNYLARDFKWLPGISYRRALAVFGVAGLFLYVVLTMISGARELMTPGAWKKEGMTYKLAPSPEELAASQQGRLAAIELLSSQLLKYASENQGEFPTRRLDGSIPMQSWLTGGAIKLPFDYWPGRTTEDHNLIIASEPSPLGEQRWALRADGSVEWLSDADLDRVFLNSFDE